MNLHTSTRWLLLLILFCGVGITAQAQSFSVTDSSNLTTATEGPHVFWQNDSTAIVFYYCNDKIESRTFSVSDTLRFFGFCGDTNTEYIITAAAPTPGPDSLADVEKLFAISDIHGDYEHFVEILVTASVIDSNLHWIWEQGHLVVNGDVFDRGPAVTECLWLIYRLEREAALAGGAVHLLLGNHELMVLRGDLRYVHERYLDGICRKSRCSYDDLFGPDMELGRWLRTKHTIMRINRTLFVHGGLRVDHVRDSSARGIINGLVRSGLDYSSPRLCFNDSIKTLYGSKGPMWFRGSTHELEGRYPAQTTVQIDSILMLCNVDEMVIGHTEQDSIVTYHDGKVIAIDVDVETLGGQRALLWQNGHFYTVSNDGTQRLFGR